eukprot:29234-Chlamydomonas_euryale.AAC.2
MSDASALAAAVRVCGSVANPPVDIKALGPSSLSRANSRHGSRQEWLVSANLIIVMCKTERAANILPGAVWRKAAKMAGVRLRATHIVQHVFLMCFHNRNNSVHAAGVVMHMHNQKYEHWYSSLPFA